MKLLKDALKNIKACIKCDKMVNLFEKACYYEKPIQVTSLLNASDIPNKQWVLEKIMNHKGLYWVFEKTKVQKAWKDGTTDDWVVTDKFKQDHFFPTAYLIKQFKRHGYNASNVSTYDEPTVEVLENGEMKFSINKPIDFSKKVSRMARKYINDNRPKKQYFIDNHGVSHSTFKWQEEVEEDDDEELL
jgi:hypothetical protein